MSTATEIARRKRKVRIRKKISGTGERPRLTVFRSNRHLTIQAIDDSTGRTLVFVSSVEKLVREKVKNNNMDAAKQAGVIFAARAKKKGIKNMVFDRNGYVYHGRIKQVAESLRENGIKI